jgi:hypothetical protein
MKARGINVCPNTNTAGKLLKDQGFSLRVNRKTIAALHSHAILIATDSSRSLKQTGNDLRTRDIPF